MATVLNTRNVDIATDKDVELSPQMAAVSRCFAVLVSCAHGLSLAEASYIKGDRKGSSDAATDLIVELLNAGGARRIQDDTKTLAALLGCELDVHVLDPKATVH